MIHYITLWCVLFSFWLLLSGHYTPMITTFGALSCGLVVYISHRMDVVDHEGHPTHMSWRIIPYTAWMLWEILKANIDVAKIILSPKMPISPVMFNTPASQDNEYGHVIYANSITLTPGTISVRLENGMIEVHALTRDTALGVLSGEMNQKVNAVKGEMEG